MVEENKKKEEINQNQIRRRPPPFYIGPGNATRARPGGNSHKLREKVGGGGVFNLLYLINLIIYGEERRLPAPPLIRKRIRIKRESKGRKE